MYDVREVVAVQTAALLEAKQLHAVHPTSRLLKYARYPDDEFVWAEFVREFGPFGWSPSAPLDYRALADLYAQYFFALEDARREPTDAVSARDQTVADSFDPDDIPY